MFDINNIGALIKILEKLVDINKIKAFIENKKDFNNHIKYIKSYEFCISFCLRQIISVLSNNQEFLDFEEDQLFIRAYDNDVSLKKFPNTTELCIFANNIYGLIDLTFKAKSYDKLMKITSDIENYIINPFKKIIYNDFEQVNKYKDQNKDTLLLKLSKSYFHMFFHDILHLRNAYFEIVNKGMEFRERLARRYEISGKKIYNVVNKGKNSKILKTYIEENLGDLFNDLSNESKEATNRLLRQYLGDQLFFEGYKLMIEYLWNTLFEDSFSKYNWLSKIIFSKNWVEFDNYFEKIRDEIILPLERRNEAIDGFMNKVFFKKNTVVNETLNILKKEIIFSIKREKLTKTDELDQLFLWYEVKLVTSHLSVPCTNEFILILAGLMKFNENLIKVIRFIHGKHSSGNKYSYAILVNIPTYHYASWYVFFNFATDYSGAGGLAKKRVDEFLHKYKSKIDLSEFRIPSKILREYMKDIEIKELNKKLRAFEDFKGDAKGLIFELINVYIFSKLGFQVHWSLKGEYTDNKEIDLLIFKKFKKNIRFYIIEVSTTEQNLIEEINEKINILKKNCIGLLKFLNFEQNLFCKFKGIAITLEETNLKANKIIKIINFKDMINNVKNLRIDKIRLYKILNLKD